MYFNCTGASIGSFQTHAYERGAVSNHLSRSGYQLLTYLSGFITSSEKLVALNLVGGCPLEFCLLVVPSHFQIAMQLYQPASRMLTVLVMFRTTTIYSMLGDYLRLSRLLPLFEAVRDSIPYPTQFYNPLSHHLLLILQVNHCLQQKNNCHHQLCSKTLAILNLRSVCWEYRCS
ncbi:hypothetical protein KC19_2G269900 [Ceratodon purpureus]|uniref:Uncharacterized protein n=1 Tax=Ceratodon purpureus TaxID=3225 RepID=A0A8T0J114_CERPU|nr:hypothetical protein KC19_2G269900 [Ceratodon purpureus]